MNLTYRAVHSFAQYLGRNPDPMEGYLLVEKSGDYISLMYDTDDPDYSKKYRSRFARARYRGKASALFLQLIGKQGVRFDIESNPNTTAIFHDELESMLEHLTAKCLAQQRANRLNALIAPDYEIDPANRVDQPQLSSSSQEIHICPRQLLILVNQMVTYLNDDNSADLCEALNYVQQRYFPNQDLSRAALLAKVDSYPFDDGVELARATEAHFRPFTFAGLWVELPTLPFAPIRVGIAMHDTRRPGCLLQMSVQKRFTDELCLLLGLENLQFAPTLRSWVEKYGQLHPAKEGLRLISNAELIWEFGQ